MTYADDSDVEVRLGRTLSEPERLQVLAWLQDIEGTIKSRIPNLDDLVTAGTLPAAVVLKIEAQAVLRVLRNPDGKLTERIDDYSWTRDSSTATGSLCLTDEEWDELTPSSSYESFSIRPYYEPGWSQCGWQA
jgi:Phage protein Gp19/Gp15/Gp42